MIPRAKILIVEDDEALSFLYSEELREEGYEPVLAKNGKEAIRILKNFKPDLVVLDIVMPVMDGMEALGRIIGRYKDLPIILNSSYPQCKEDFMSWAADAYLTKSSDLTGLKEAIRDLLKKRREKKLVQTLISYKMKKGGDTHENGYKKRENKKSELQFPCSSGREGLGGRGLQ